MEKSREILAVENSKIHLYFNLLLHSYFSPVLSLFSVLLSPYFFLPFKPKCGLACGCELSEKILDIVFLIPKTRSKSDKSSCCFLLGNTLHFAFPLH